MISLKKRQSQMLFWIELSTRQSALNSRENPGGKNEKTVKIFV